MLRKSRNVHDNPENVNINFWGKRKDHGNTYPKDEIYYFDPLKRIVFVRLLIFYMVLL